MMRPSHRLVSQALATVQQSGADLFVAQDAGFEGSDIAKRSSTNDHRLEQHARARHPCWRMAPGRPAASSSSSSSKDTAAASNQGADALLGRVAGQASALLFSSRRLDEEEHLDCSGPAVSGNLAGTLARWSSAQPHQQQQQKQSLLQQQLHLQRLHAEAHQQLLRARMRRKQQIVDSDSSTASTPVSRSCAGSTNSTPGLEQGSNRCGSPAGGPGGATEAGCPELDQQPGVACCNQCSSASTQPSGKADAGPADSDSSCCTAVMQRSQTVSSNLAQACATQQGPASSSAVGMTPWRPSEAAAAVDGVGPGPAGVCVYACEAGTSAASLDLANSTMASLVLPDGVRYLPVQPDSVVFKLAAGWQLPAFVVCLGSSYYQRMLHRVPQLAHAARCCPGMEEFAADLDKPVVRLAQLSGPDAVAALSSLRCIQFSCIFLALKAVDKVHALGLLRFMLSKLSHDGAAVSPAQAAGIEAKCLAALDWRLGPVFAEDELLGLAALG